MASSLTRDIPTPQPTQLNPTNTLWTRSARSIVATAKVTNPTAQQTIVTIKGFQTWQQEDIYRLDWIAGFGASTPGISADFAIYLNGQQWFILPTLSIADTRVTGTVFLDAGDIDIAILALAGGTGVYVASLILTRLLNGFRAG